MNVEAFGPEGVVYDDGTIARNSDIAVMVYGTNTLATVYADTNGNSVASNPVRTDAIGNLFFFVETGIYELVIRGTRIPVEVTAGPAGPAGPPGTNYLTEQEALALTDPPNMTVVFENALI